MKIRVFCMALALCVGSAWAQGQDYQAMAKAMEKAQAEASKPGDDILTCEQLEGELFAATQTPDFQAHVGDTAAEAEKRKKEMDLPKGQIAMQTFRAALMSTTPGAAMGGMAQAQAQAMAQGAQGMKQMKERAERTQKLTALLPTLMRGQRLIELASAKSCGWAANTGQEQQ